jgi:hypothetical protein
MSHVPGEHALPDFSAMDKIIFDSLMGGLRLDTIKMILTPSSRNNESLLLECLLTDELRKRFEIWTDLNVIISSANFNHRIERWANNMISSKPTDGSQSG